MIEAQHISTGLDGAGRLAFARALEQGPELNGTEQAYADHLDEMVAAGEVKEYRPHPFKVKLAPSTFYEPDFLVVMPDGVIEIHEVKGFWRDDARVKIKVAAAMFPWWRWKAVSKVAKKRGGGWSVEVFKP